MTCNFSLSGTKRDCKNSLGGVREIYLAIRGVDVSPQNITVNETTGKVTAITMETGKLFRTYQLRDNVANMTTSVNTSNEAGTTYYETTVTFSIAKLTAEKRMELHNIARAELVVIVRDRMNRYWLIGKENAAYLSAGAINTGTNMADANQIEFTLMCQESEPPREIVDSILPNVIDTNMSYPIPTP